jgi:hypothetical protein
MTALFVLVRVIANRSIVLSVENRFSTIGKNRKRCRTPSHCVEQMVFP